MKKTMFLSILVSLFLFSACSYRKTQSLEKFYRNGKIENADRVFTKKGNWI